MTWLGGIFASLACVSQFFFSVPYYIFSLMSTSVFSLIPLGVLIALVYNSTPDGVTVGVSVGGSLYVFSPAGVKVIF